MDIDDVGQLVDAIDREELASLAFELGSIESSSGKEGAAADHVEAWLREQGFRPTRIGMFEHRPTIAARLPGARRGGKVLVFNAHLDTAISREDVLTYRDPSHPRYIDAWREGDTLFGNGVVNDKAPMAAFLVAAAVLRRRNVQLGGDVLLSCVPGEIGVEPMDELGGPDQHGKDIGTRYAIAHGLVGDAALVAEATGYGLGWVEAGKAFFRVTVFGTEPMYTPYVPVQPDALRHPNAIVRASVAIQVLNEWATKYADQRYECPGGVVQGRANIGAIRSGNPGKITKSTELCHLYLDVRTLPSANPLDVQREIEGVLVDAGLDASVELVLHRRGFESHGIEPLARAVRAAHAAEFGSEPTVPSVQTTSMWRDTNPFIEAGIPSLMYGPSSSTGGGNFSIAVDDIVTSARVYLRTAVNYLGLA